MLAWLLGGCAVEETPTQTPRPTVTRIAKTATRPPTRAVPIVTAFPSDLPPTPLPAADGIRYFLDLKLDYAQKTARVIQHISYPNRTNQPLEDLLLIVEPSRRDGVFRLLQAVWDPELRMNFTGDPIQGWTLGDGLLRVPLTAPLSPGEEISFSLEYQLNLPPEPGVLGYSARQVNFGDWYPFLPPLDPDLGWLAYAPNSVGEHLSYPMAEFYVEAEVANAPDGLTTAASAPAQHVGNEDHFHVEAARNFTLSFSPDYGVRHFQQGSIQVFSYAFPESVEAGIAAGETAAKALALYAEYFGPYPHKHLAIVAGNFPDGMEFDGLFFISQTFYDDFEEGHRNLLTILAAHETAHQWWYGLIGNDQAMDPWLDEAIATYCEALYFEEFYPDDLGWWWAFRVNYFSPEIGYLDDSIYQYGSFRPYVDAIYLRGALFMEDLRRQLGDDDFFKALQVYSNSYRGSSVTSEDFFSTIRRVSQVDLESTLLKYFRADYDNLTVP